MILVTLLIYIIIIIDSYSSGKIERVLLGFSLLLDETEYTADNYKDLIEEILERFGKSLENVLCFVGDNCSTNVTSLAKKTGIPLIGKTHDLYLLFMIILYYHSFYRLS